MLPPHNTLLWSETCSGKNYLLDIRVSWVAMLLQVSAVSPNLATTERTHEMNDEQKALLKTAYDLQAQLWRIFEEQLSPPQMALLRSYEGLWLYSHLLDGSLHRGPNLPLAGVWKTMRRRVSLTQALLDLNRSPLSDLVAEPAPQ